MSRPDCHDSRKTGLAGHFVVRRGFRASYGVFSAPKFRVASFGSNPDRVHLGDFSPAVSQSVDNPYEIGTPKFSASTMARGVLRSSPLLCRAPPLGSGEDGDVGWGAIGLHKTCR